MTDRQTGIITHTHTHTHMQKHRQKHQDKQKHNARELTDCIVFFSALPYAFPTQRVNGSMGHLYNLFVYWNGVIRRIFGYPLRDVFA